MTTAGLYARISQDDDGDAAGVERQQRACASYCKRHGLEIVGTFVDNDVSASRYARKKRPEYRRLIDATRNGVDVICTYHIDRLYRQPHELEELIDLAEDGTVEVHTLNGPLDLRTGDGRANARILVTMAAKSTDDDSRRWKSLKDHLAVEGLPAGGARPFGYEPGGMEIRDDEAKLLRGAAASVLAGESLTNVARRWNAAGVKPPQSKKGTWTATQVRSLLTNPRHAGLRTHRGEVVGPAQWPPTLDRATHERLDALLNDPARKRRTPPRRSLLTGLIFCGLCGGPLTRATNNGKPVLRCKRAPGLPGCGRLAILALPTETLVAEYVIARLDATAGIADAHAALHDDTGDRDAAAGELEALEERLTDIGEMFAAGEITRGEYTRMRASVAEKIADARRRLRPARGRDALDAITGKIGDVWDGLSDDRKREIIGAVVERVTIAPAMRRRGFDPARVTIS